jgi:predicted small secreted protein
MKRTKHYVMIATLILAVVLTLLVLTGCSGKAEAGKDKKSSGGKGGATATYTEAIPFVYDDALDFSEGLAAVCKDGKWGFIDSTGAEVIPFIYDVVTPFSEGLAAARLEPDGLLGFIDTTGAEVIPPTYNGVTSFSEGLAAVQIGDKEGLDPEIFFIDKTGKVITPSYYSAEPFNEGVAMVQYGMSHYIWIDKTGKEILAAGGTRRGTSFSEGLAMVYHFENEYFIDTSGKEVISLKDYPGLNDVELFSEGLALVKGYREVAPEDMIKPEAGQDAPPMQEPTGENGMYRVGIAGYIDKTGKMVIELPEVSLGFSFSEGLAAVSCHGGGYRGWGFIDKSGAFVIEPNPDWDWAFEFSEGYAAVQSKGDGLWGFIDRGGNEVVPCKYELPELLPLKVSEGMAALSLDGKWGFIKITD